MSPLAGRDKASSCCCLPLVRLLQTFWFSHGNPLAVIHLSVRGVVSPHGFSARHPAPWHCLVGFEPQRHPTPLFSLPSSSKLHGTAQLPSPRSCSSLPSPIPLALLPASYSHLLSPLHGAHLSNSHHTTGNSRHKPNAATHHRFVFIVWLVWVFLNILCSLATCVHLI